MKKLFTALIILTAHSLFAQQDALFSQYLYNRMAINPGYAGSREQLSAELTYRNQWVNIVGSPKTISVSLHSPIINDNLAGGLTLYNDKLGPLSYTGFMGTFAYRIIFPKGKLSFGIQAGIKNNGITWNDIESYNMDDPFLLYKIKKKIVPDASFGVYYYTDTFFAGLSSKELFQFETVMVTDTAGRTQFSKLLRHFYAVTGTVIPMTDNMVFRPSVLFKYTKNAPVQADITGSVLYKDMLGVGLSFRTGTALTLFTELGVLDNLRIGYSYDLWLNQLMAYNQGSHEIQICYDFALKQRIRTPRYF